MIETGIIHIGDAGLYNPLNSNNTRRIDSDTL